MKIAAFALSLVLQLIAASLSGGDRLTLILSGSCLALALVISVLGIVKYKAKLAYLTLLTGVYLLSFFVYHLFAGIA